MVCRPLIDWTGGTFLFRDEEGRVEWLTLGDELPLEPDPLGLLSGFRWGVGDAPLRLSSFVISSTLGDFRFRLERSGVDTSRPSCDLVDLARMISGINSAPSSSKALYNLALSLLSRQIPVTMSHDIVHNAKLILAFNLENSGWRLDEIVKRSRNAIGMASM
jgi:hypothetical protein